MPATEGRVKRREVEVEAVPPSRAMPVFVRVVLVAVIARGHWVELPRVLPFPITLGVLSYRILALRFLGLCVLCALWMLWMHPPLVLHS